MKPAQQDEVVEFGLTPIGPMHDVMAIDEARVHTARKPATAVAAFQRAVNCGWNRPCFAPDIQRFALPRLANAYDRAVTCDPAHRFGRQHRSILHLRRIVRIDRPILRQRFRGSVDNDLIAIGAVESFVPFRRLLQKSFG